MIGPLSFLRGPRLGRERPSEGNRPEFFQFDRLQDVPEEGRIASFPQPVRTYLPVTVSGGRVPRSCPTVRPAVTSQLIIRSMLPSVNLTR